MISKTLAGALAVGAGAVMFGAPAQADDLGDLKALVKELKAQLQEERTQIRDLKAEVKGLNAELTAQKTHLSAQGAAVESQGGDLRRVEAEQKVLAEKQQAAPAAVAAAAPTVAAKPGYIAVPGTSSSVRLGGYVKVDLVDDVAANIGANGFTKTATDFASIPLDHSAASRRSGQVNFTAQESRLNFATSTRTEKYGDIETAIEGDFYNVGSGNLFRLRHAYVSGAGFLAGQTWSTFVDLDSSGPELLDFNGPVGIVAARQPQIRYTMPVRSGSLPPSEMAFALESPTGDIATNTADNHLDKTPDVVARFTMDPSWGHVAVAGLGRYLASDSGAPGRHPNQPAYGVLVGVKINTVGKDSLVFQTVDGNGVGRYLLQGQGVSAVMVNNTLKPITIWGGSVGYTHFWTDALRSSLAYGYGHFSTPAGDPLRPLKDMSSVHVNLIWSPIPAASMGMEYIYGHVETSSPQYDTATGTTASQGSASRVQASVKYSF
ncbi:MAG: hypothetical protein F8N37_22390 [Telmatospirillum sp.]|nr:hypothetical protein [Telmatospirillum sp.]